jgi:hypothetical protein
MKIYKLILTACICVLSFNNGQAQTKAKTTTTKQTKKTGTKKPAKPLSVYVCTSPKDKFFHKYSSCKNLNKCSGEIKNIKSAAELKKYKRKSCLHCFNL